MLPILRPDATPAERRASIMAFEALLKTHPQAISGDSEQLPLRHTFGDGLYLREIFIPAGSLLTGKIHKHSHPVFLVAGVIRIATEHDGVQDLHAPRVFMAPRGVKRAALALTDVVWVTVHATQETDLEKLEAELIAPDFEAYDQWVAQLQEGRAPCHLSLRPSS